MTMRGVLFLTVLLFVSAAQASRLYLGCYADYTQLRALPFFIGESIYMTSQICTDACRYFGFEYAGTQGGDECRCGNGNRFAMYGSRSDSQCNQACDGDASQTCGGNSRNSVYSTGMWYNGCFKDGVDGIDQLSNGIIQYIPHNTVFNCVQFCTSEDYLFAGMSGDICKCGNIFGNLPGDTDFLNIGFVPDSECDLTCPAYVEGDAWYPGFDDMICGGSNRISIYHTLNL